MNIVKASELSQTNITALIYGTPGMGKTSLLGKLNGRTLIIDVDKGSSVLNGSENVDVLFLSEDFSEIPELLKELSKNNPYKNICIDSISELERAIIARLASKNENGIPALKDYGRVNNSVLNLCRQLRAFQSNIFITAWEKYTDVIAPSGEKYSRIEPLIRDKNLENICGLCDLIGRLFIDKDNEKRMVWLQAKPNIIAKDRIFKRTSCSFDDFIPEI